MAEEVLKKKLAQRAEDQSLRSLKSASGLTDFCSNDYLGLARSSELAGKINAYFTKVGFKGNGATGSRLLSGNTDDIVAVEKKLASIFKSEAALLFNSGYSANLGILSSIPQKGDTIIYDELSHACIKDGARLSLANRYSFRHNDPDDLRNKLSRASGNIFIVVESIYSMDGDACLLHDVVAIAEKSGANIIIDEAHSTGLMGKQGGGMVIDQQLENRNFIARVYTFGKAMGIHGACVAGSRTLIDYLINYARPFIYTTAMPPHSIAAIDAAFDYLAENSHLQVDIQEKVALFIRLYENKLAPLGYYQRVNSQSPVQALIVPGNDRVKAVTQQLNDKGYDIRPILSPTVKSGEERLRICLHTYNTKEEIQGLVNALSQIHI